MESDPKAPSVEEAIKRLTKAIAPHVGSRAIPRYATVLGKDLRTLLSLSERVRVAVEALEPFAKVADNYEPETPRDTRLGDDFEGSEVLYGRNKPDLGDFRPARQSLAVLKGE